MAPGYFFLMHICFFDACWIFFLMHLQYFFFDTCLHRHVVSIPVATRETLFVCACGHICHSHELFRRDATRLIPALWAEEAPFGTVSTQANIDHKCKQEHKRNRTNQPTNHPSIHPSTHPTTTTTTTPCKSESLAAKRCKYQSKPSNPKKREKNKKKREKNPKKNCSPFSIISYIKHLVPVQYMIAWRSKLHSKTADCTLASVAHSVCSLSLPLLSNGNFHCGRLATLLRKFLPRGWGVPK